MLLTGCVISHPSPFLCFWIANLFRTPLTADPYIFKRSLQPLVFRSYLRNLYPIKFWQLNIILVILHFPSPVFSGITPPVCFSFFYQLLLPRSLLLQPPPPERTVDISHLFLLSCFIIISFNPNVQHIYFFLFISESQISPRIKI